MFVDIIAGARPNFMKIAPVIKSFEENHINYRLIHTGQHYDQSMSDNFFKDLGIPEPDHNLNVGSGSHALQTGKIMLEYEKLLNLSKPKLCLVFGDVNSTLSCSITAKKMKIEVGHVEAGIRSFDISMPEEINRMVTDSITDYFFTTSQTANKNLLNLGVDKKKIFFVGNTMIDTLVSKLYELKKPDLWEKYKLSRNNFIVLTLHRPSNVDSSEKLNLILKNISGFSKNYKIIFPSHPRNKKNIDKLDINLSNLIIIDPLRYLEFIYLVKNSKCVITDSGGITEETTYLNIPCLTLRTNTERPETCEIGSNILVGNDFKKLEFYLSSILNNQWKKSIVPPMWDGKTSNRISKHIKEILNC